MALLCTVPTHSFAHEDHGAAQVAADATVIAQQDRTLQMILTMYNLSPHSVTLFAVGAPGAQPVEALFTTLPAREMTQTQIELTFEDDIPGLFTAVLDFGEDGQGPVLVLP